MPTWMWKATRMSSSSYLVGNVCYKNSIAAIVTTAKAVQGSSLWPRQSHKFDCPVRLTDYFKKEFSPFKNITKHCNINKYYKSIRCVPLLPTSLESPIFHPILLAPASVHWFMNLPQTRAWADGVSFCLSNFNKFCSQFSLPLYSPFFRKTSWILLTICYLSTIFMFASTHETYCISW